MPSPLVTVICLCYNQAPFVRQAIQSVFDQSYPFVQLVVIDDASTDASVNEINKIISGRQIEFLALKENVGNCKAFNRGLTVARGEFVIDLAADDVLWPDRVEKQVTCFQSLSPDYGVLFSDAEYIDEKGSFIRHHFKHLLKNGLITSIPEGDVYADVLSTYFIPSPTMMIRKRVLDALHGYDENLAYEDFDFWVRSSRICRYAFFNECLTKVRKRPNSMSSGWYRQGDRQLHSTYLVCRKAQKLNQNQHEVDALIRRVKFELRQSVFSKNANEAKLFFDLLSELKSPGIREKFLMALVHLPLPLPALRKWYHSLRYSL